MQNSSLVIAITGAARGLGKAMATTLHAQGHQLILVDKNTEALKDISAKLSGVTIAGLDVTDEQAVVSFFEKIRQSGRLDVLVNNAGLLDDGLLIKAGPAGDFDAMSLDQWQRVIDVNMTGVFLCTRSAAGIMAKQQSGVIVNLSSIARAGNAGQTNYSASKAAVEAMTVTWAQELGRHGIRVAAIAPGFIGTDMVAQVRQEILDKMVARVPLRRMGQAEDVADALSFIIHNPYFNGRVLELDGGLRF